MASIDLKDAYYTVAVHFEQQKCLQFVFEGTLSQYTCLPNGLFTKLLKPVHDTLCSMGHLNSGYIDDSYLQGDTFNECSCMMTSMGFTLIFLGFILN